MTRFRGSSVVLSVVVVAVAVFYVWPEDDATSVELPTLIDLTPAQTRRILIENREGQRAEFVNQGDSEWEPGAGTPSLGRTLMFDVEDRILPLQGYRELPRLDVDDPDYGLGDPEITFTVKSVAGKSYTVEVGQQTFNTGGFYARRPGGKLVVLIPRGPMDDLRSLAAGKRIDTPTRVDEKLLEVEKEQLAKVERSETSPWLEQVLETGGAEVEDAPDEPGNLEEEAPAEDVDQDLEGEKE